jgi:hypothetical protein
MKPKQASKHKSVDADRLCAPGRPARIGKNPVRERTRENRQAPIRSAGVVGTACREGSPGNRGKPGASGARPNGAGRASAGLGLGETARKDRDADLVGHALPNRETASRVPGAAAARRANLEGRTDSMPTRSAQLTRVQIHGLIEPKTLLTQCLCRGRSSNNQPIRTTVNSTAT